LKSNYILNVDIPGFNFIHNPSQTNSGGVGLYIYSNLTNQPRNDLNLNNIGCESLFIEINKRNKPTSSGKLFIIGVIYCHPTYTSQPFQDEFFKLVTHLQNNYYDYLIDGDYNINLIKYQENSNVLNYVDCLASCGCISLINKRTRFSKNSKPSSLDHIYTNICDEKIIINSGITIFYISDHLPIFVNFNLHHPTHQNSKPKFRCMKHFDPTIFVSDLSIKLNNLNPEANDVNTPSDEFVKIFNDTLACSISLCI